MIQKTQAFFGNNSQFMWVISILCVVALVVSGQPAWAMWFGFIVAGFSAMSNDSIQTLGTFLSSNRNVSWKILWLFIGSIMVATIFYGWLTHGGDISYGRLEKIPETTEFTLTQLMAPVILIILTRFRMPVSTTFLLLAVFSSSQTINGMLVKTILGYGLAFVLAILVWGSIGLLIKSRRENFKREMTQRNERRWRILQWLSTGFLWSSWLMQDNANAAVFLPRSLSFTQLLFVLAFMVLALGFVFKRRGGEIQQVIEEKTDVVYVKSATIIDFTYALILVYFKQLNNLPMSTTWVFLGLLAGREIALRATLHKDKPYGHTLKLVGKDIARAGIGLAISLTLAFL
ncbi:hypothetical protein BH23PAT1_BH23PAT1_2390 [soil metagenome]